MKQSVVFALSLLVAAFAFGGAINIDISGQGLAKKEVSINVSNQAFARSLRNNLERSGLFVVKPGGSIVVSGTPGVDVKAEGAGNRVTVNSPVTDDASARMAARRLSDAMCEAYGNQKGFACDRIVFRKCGTQEVAGGVLRSELCSCYPDGYDIKQLTADGGAVVGPRWQDESRIFYTNLKDGPQIYELDVATGRRKLRWSFKGLCTGAAVSPDGTKVAIILSFQGNPELYVIPIGGKTFTRLTTTPNASEGQPAWSPDGKEIVYVSDETRSQQLYVVNVETRAKRRLTSVGKANREPDWGKDGRIVYTSGGVIKVMSPAEGDRAAKAITTTGGWKHPSWARDGRHVVASSGKVLFILDTVENGDSPKAIFNSPGNWCDPSWRK